MIDPDFFGCSGKLSFEETWRLASGEDGRGPAGDYSVSQAYGEVITSIDRVHRCAKDWDSFARIALNHAFGDVICAGARPFHVMLSFEFGIDTPANERKVCSEAFAATLNAKGIALGKCHSSLTGGVTAVTISTMAVSPSMHTPALDRGILCLSRPIGAFKLHYLQQLGIDTSGSPLSSILEADPNPDFHSQHWSHLTDVSGHGLIGAVATAARLYGLDVELELSPMVAISADVLTTPVECLQNPISSYDLDFDGHPVEALTLLTLRETAGPYLGFLEDAGQAKEIAADRGVMRGRYQRGAGGVKLSWQE